MAGQFISCSQYANYLVTQTPVYDKEILRDIRPTAGDLMGYYKTSKFDAYTSTSHYFDRFRHVFPDVRKTWSSVGETNCTGKPCDPEANRIGWGWDRFSYGMERQSWESEVLCFDAIMTKTRAKEHFQQIIEQILRPATAWIMSTYLARKAAENAGKKICVASGLPDFTFTWDAGGYNYITVDKEPTGKLNPNILQRQVFRHQFNGATKAGKDSFGKLELHTDADTFRDLTVLNPTLLTAWRITEFDSAAEMYYKYGFNGTVGDFLVKVLQFPLRFNKVSATRFQLVLPWKYEAASEGIKSSFNTDYDNAQFQFSYINHREGMEVQPFNPEAVNPNMPYMVRDYGGKWNFAIDNLGGDAQGRPIDNVRRNKGKFFADFQIAVKPVRPEWIDLLWHMRDKPCVTIDAVCNAYPGYPAQSYNDGLAECACASQMNFTPVKNTFSQYVVAANTLLVNGAAITHSAIVSASIANLVIALQSIWSTASYDGTWAADGATGIKITWTAAQTVQNSIAIDFVE